MKILLLEDDLVLNKSIKKFLQMQMFEVLSFYTGDETIEAIDASIDLYILDINVKGLNGIDVLESIRMFDEKVPIIMISAETSIETIMQSYAKGCNDYLKKPFDIRELKIKIDHLSTYEMTIVNLGENYHFDLKTDTLYQNQVPIKLTKKELKLLRLLVKNRGINVTYARIIDCLWEDDPSDVNMDAVRSIASRLRHKLPKNLIVSNVGLGYSLA
ncbi:MAG: response regulator transcription factor [Campylobacterales bacterium]|nr:response regulator transcription factor [Campylobacterales bacterium]